MQSLITDHLAAYVSCHFFSDDSGLVLFHQLTGETLGLALTSTGFLGLCRERKYPDSFSVDNIRLLNKMLVQPKV